MRAGQATGLVLPAGEPQTRFRPRHPAPEPGSFLLLLSLTVIPVLAPRTPCRIRQPQSCVFDVSHPPPLPSPHSLPLGWQLDLPRSSGRLGKPWQLFAPDPSRAPESQSASHHPLVRPILPVLCRWPLRGQRQSLLKQQGVARPCFNPDSVLIHQATLGPVPSGPETKKRETGGC